MTLPFDPPAFALEWCRRLSASPGTLEPLEGGINNQVFRCWAGKCWFVLKRYAPINYAGHDRFKAEVEFLTHAQLVAPEYVPKLLYSDEVTRSVVLEYLEGERYPEAAHPNKEDVERAIAFMQRLNTDLRMAKELVSGSAAEGFLRLTEHLQNIAQRLERMSIEHLPSDMRDEAKGIIKSAKVRLERLQDNTLHLLSQGYCDDYLEPSKRRLSPSDFGFHNAIRTPEGARFLDFEFAGWDDPTKTVADFDLQPRVPIKWHTQALIKAVPNWDSILSTRYQILFPILKLKWVSIIVAMLNPIRCIQIQILDKDHGINATLRDKLKLARKYLN